MVAVPEIRFYMAELREAIAHIHDRGFVHRDIKPDNICFSKEGHLKLLGFGLCEEALDSRLLKEEDLRATPADYVLVDDDGKETPAGEYLQQLQVRLSIGQYLRLGVFAGAAGNQCLTLTCPSWCNNSSRFAQ